MQTARCCLLVSCELRWIMVKIDLTNKQCKYCIFVIILVDEDWMTNGRRALGFGMTVTTVGRHSSLLFFFLNFAIFNFHFNAVIRRCWTCSNSLCLYSTLASEDTCSCSGSHSVSSHLHHSHPRNTLWSWRMQGRIFHCWRRWPLSLSLDWCHCAWDSISFSTTGSTTRATAGFIARITDLTLWTETTNTSTSGNLLLEWSSRHG